MQASFHTESLRWTLENMGGENIQQTHQRIVNMNALWASEARGTETVMSEERNLNKQEWNVWPSQLLQQGCADFIHQESLLNLVSCLNSDILHQNRVMEMTQLTV